MNNIIMKLHFTNIRAQLFKALEAGLSHRSMILQEFLTILQQKMGVFLHTYESVMSCHTVTFDRPGPTFKLLMFCMM